MTTSVLVTAVIVLSALVMRLTDAAPGALVVLPSAKFLANLPANSALTEATRFTVTFDAEPGMTRVLYDAGAWLVLPAGLSGCLKPPEAFRI